MSVVGLQVNLPKKAALLFALLYLAVLFQSCYCSSFVSGYNVISHERYMPPKDWGDSSLFYHAMKQLSIEHPELSPDTADLINLASNQDSNTFYEKTACPPCLIGENCICIHRWYLISRTKQMVFNIGLYAEGFAIESVYIKKNGHVLFVSSYELCTLNAQERKKLRQEITSCFESEILPVMEPYFDRIKKR